MIAIVFGVPGSGKTFFAVSWIKRRALTESDVFFRVRDDVLLISNIRLNLDSEDNYVYIQDFEDWKKYMDVDFWRANLGFIQGKKIIMVMDEAQAFFQNYKDDHRVLFFLQYHRHLSVDLLLITQTLKSMPQKVIELCEYIVEAVPRSVNPFSPFGFRYRVLHPFDRSIVLRRFHLGFDPVIFHLYSDMIYRMDEERPQNAFRMPMFVLASFLLLFVFLFFSFFSTIFSRSQPKLDHSRSSQSASVVPSGGSRDFRYEDLIWDRPLVEFKSSGSSFDAPSNATTSEDDHGSRLVVPSQPTYRIVVGSSGVRSDGSNEDKELSDGPKVIYLP